MYRYQGCRWPFPHRITGDGYTRLMCQDGENVDPDNDEFRVNWTPENNEYLIELREQGKSFSEIADIFYAVEASVARHYHCLVKSGEAKSVRPNYNHKLNSEKMKYVISQLGVKPIKELAGELNVTTRAITTRLNAQGYRAARGNKYVMSVWEKVA